MDLIADACLERAGRQFCGTSSQLSRSAILCVAVSSFSALDCALEEEREGREEGRKKARKGGRGGREEERKRGSEKERKRERQRERQKKREKRESARVRENERTRKRRVCGVRFRSSGSHSGCCPFTCLSLMCARNGLALRKIAGC